MRTSPTIQNHNFHLYQRRRIISKNRRRRIISKNVGQSRVNDPLDIDFMVQTPMHLISRTNADASQMYVYTRSSMFVCLCWQLCKRDYACVCVGNCEREAMFV